MDSASTAGGAQAPAEQRVRLYETLLHTTPDLVYMWDLQHRFTYANAALLAMWGKTWDEAIGKHCLELGYEPWHAAMHDREIDQVIATRQPVRGDVPFNGTNGRRIYDYLLMPVIGPDGEVEAVAGTTRDVTERKQHEEARRRSEERLAAMVDATSDLVYRTNADWSEVDIVGGNQLLGRHGSLTPDWLDVLVHPDDRTLVAEAIARARASQSTYSAEHRVRNEEGAWSWIASRAVPIQPIGGEVTEWFGAATDITARKQHEDHQRLLLNELNHRVKNTLAIVQSIALQTLRGADGMGPAVDRFESRLHALAQAHDVLTRQEWEHAPLHDIVRTAVAPCLQDGPGRFDIDGPPIQLEPQRALALSMALHELCTNAMKFGALSVAHGHVRVHWSTETRDGRRLLVLHWQEADGPPVTPPAQRGYGARLIERGLRHDLGGDVALAFEPAGVHCRITAPMPELDVAA